MKTSEEIWAEAEARYKADEKEGGSMTDDLTTNEQSEALRTRIVTLCTYLPDAELTEAIDTMIASLRHNGGRFTYQQHATLTAMIKRLSVKRHMEKVEAAKETVEDKVNAKMRSLGEYMAKKREAEKWPSCVSPNVNKTKKPDWT